MYAVIEMQGSQFRVEKNDTIVVNRISDVKNKPVRKNAILKSACEKPRVSFLDYFH